MAKYERMFGPRDNPDEHTDVSPRHRKVSSFEIYREKILNPRNVADMGAESKSQVADRIVWFMHV